MIVNHQNQHREIESLSHQPALAQKASAGTRFMEPSNSAPSPTLHRDQTCDDSLRAGYSTAPVYGQIEMGADLPPERSLPFPTKKGIDNLPEKSRSQTTDEKQAASCDHAVVSLSERKSISPNGKHTKTKEQLHVEDIDTQLLLAKVKARKSNFSKHRQRSTALTKQSTKNDSQTSTSLGKPRRNIRCLSCRSKRCKCERHSEDPDGACVPCVTAGNKCSFVADMDLVSDDAEPKASCTQVPNTQEAVSQTSQPLRISLRVRGVPPLKKLDEENNPESQESKKRSSQIAMPAPKRVKRAKEDDDVQVQQSSTNHGIASDVEVVPVMRKSNTRLRTPLKPPRNLSDTIRSDATTMTATTLDLDPVTPNPNAKFPRIPPKELAASLQSNGPDLQSDPQTVNANVPQTFSSAAPESISLDRYPSTTHDNAQEIYQTFMNSGIGTFLKQDDESQSDILGSLFSIALFDEDFLAFAKVVEQRFETNTFDGKDWNLPP